MPLIPLEGGDLLIAGWVFELHLHFDAWIKLAMEEEPRLWDMYANIAGREFEEYVASKVSKSDYKVFRNVVVSEKEFPQISECLQRLGKKGFFELDIIVIVGDRMYVVSCKGGKKEIPKLYKSKYWVFLSEKEIIDRLNENIREAHEIIKEARCLRKCRDIVTKLFNADIKETVPILVYAFPQPLAIDEFKTRSELPKDITIITPRQLSKLVQASIQCLSIIHVWGIKTIGDIREKFKYKVFKWRARRDLNPGPPAPKAGALSGLGYGPCFCLYFCL